jgi:glutathione synthase
MPLHLLSQAEAEGANIVNRPSALKKFNEKIFALQFSHWMPDTSVICKEKDFELFKQKYSTIILKPLDGMGGESIYKFDENSEDHLKIFKSLTNNYQTMVMVQNFLPEIYDGDYRILIIHGKPFPLHWQEYLKVEVSRAILQLAAKVRLGNYLMINLK